MIALTVCDDSAEQAILAAVAQLAGLTVVLASDLERAMGAWNETPGNAIVLALRGIPLAQQVRRVRSETEAPLVVVGDACAEDELCSAYEAGADLVVGRPFSARLLVRQWQALLRRSRGARSLGLPKLTSGVLTLDPVTRQVQLEGRTARRLTHLEFRLLHTLMSHQGQTLPIETIIEHVWGYSGEGSMEMVRVLISRLRAKVETDPKNPGLILTVPGVGYRLATL